MKKYSRGQNPASHHNKQLEEGTRRTIRMPDDYWRFVELIGEGKEARGVRAAVEKVRKMAINNLSRAASILRCSPTEEDVSFALVKKFPQIQEGMKNAQSLTSEICLGESYLTRDEDLSVIRVVDTVVVDIYCGEYRLSEKRQEWKDGSVVWHNRWGIYEKIMDGETSLQSAIRATREKIGIHLLESYFLEETRLELNDKSSYLGISSFSKLHCYTGEMLKNDFSLEYRAEQRDKTTVFVFIKNP